MNIDLFQIKLTYYSVEGALLHVIVEYMLLDLLLHCSSVSVCC